MVNTIVSPRPTVAGFLLRLHHGLLQLGTHVPQKCGNNLQLTTVGGGIEAGETAEEAMQRELAEEYGFCFATECDVVRLVGFDNIVVSSSGILKQYQWFQIWVSSDIWPWINRDEVRDFRWRSILDIDAVTSAMSQGKGAMLSEVYSEFVGGVLY